MLKENEVYVIQFDYSTEDCDGVDLYLKMKKLFKISIKFTI